MTGQDSLAFVIVFFSGALAWPAAELVLSHLVTLKKRHRRERSVRI